jgi:carbon monoxide dehydrogenase subunit G
MRQTFSERIEVAAAPGDVWPVVGDIPTVLSWISVVGEVQAVEPGSRYSAVLVDRLGPFKLRADLDIGVLEREDGRRVRAHADGEDRQIGSRLIIDVELELEPDGEHTVIGVSGAYEVTGRPASLGAASIRKKAAHILAEFFGRAAEAPAGSSRRA